jgi:hypothetical protein
MPQIEMSAPLPVADAGGRLVNFGWARSPLFTYDGALVPGPARRITASDRYVIFSPAHCMVLEIQDGGYLGYAGITIISLLDKKRYTQSYVTPFPLGSYGMPNTSETGTVRVLRKQARIEFVAMESGARIIKVDIAQFGRNRQLRGALVLSAPPGAESIVTHMPILRDKRAFMLSRRSPWYTVEGVMQFGGAELVFTKGKAWGVLDWNRGRRSRLDVRYWASACGAAGERLIGFNVGYGSADSSLGTENAFFLDGKLHKLDQVTFHISPANWMEPWRFTASDTRLEMTLLPSQTRTERRRALFHTLTRRQVCGSFSGKAVLDNGEEFHFQDLPGFAERCKTRF